MIQIRVLGNKGYKDVYALLDEGATVSLINEKIMQTLEIKTFHTDVYLKGIGKINILANSNK